MAIATLYEGDRPMPCDGPVHLRRAAVGDASGIAQVHVEGWRTAHAGLVPEEYLACVSSRLHEGSWREELAVEASDRKPWVALVDDRIVGFASAGLSRDEDAGSEVGEVYLVYVDPDCWGRGIGKSLIEHVVRDLRQHGFERASFWVVADNAKARAFAERHGWQDDGETRFEDCGGTQVEQVRYSLALR